MVVHLNLQASDVFPIKLYDDTINVEEDVKVKVYFL